MIVFFYYPNSHYFIVKDYDRVVNNFIIHQPLSLSSFMIALTESLLVSRSNLMASAFEHLPYSMTILMFSGLNPSSERSSAEGYSTLGASDFPSVLPSVLAAVTPSGLTGLVNWLTSFWPAPIPSRLGLPKIT